METDITLVWHVHHEVILEALTEPIENRMEFIMVHKPVDEQSLRLRLMKPVTGKVPDPVMVAGKRVVEAANALNKSRMSYLYEPTSDVLYSQLLADREVFDHTNTDFIQVLAGHEEAIKALHAVECLDCPWDGHTIFPPKH